MKKEIPKPLIAGSLALVAVVLAVVGYRALSGPGELPKPKNSTAPPPAYILEKLSPEMRGKMGGSAPAGSPAGGTGNYTTPQVLPPTGVPGSAGK